MPIGKRVADNFYVHISAIEAIEDEATRNLITESLGLLAINDRALVNVIKIHETTSAVSMLQYSDFDTDPFPRLVRGWLRSSGRSDVITRRTYEHSSNPPILHRKELMVSTDYPGRAQWVELTQSAESLGLFDDTTTIGFALNWDRLIGSKGMQLQDGQFLPLGNDVSSTIDHDLSADISGTIYRHRTALARVSLSSPVQFLVRHDLLPTGTTFFDYGCGRGGDMERLAAAGFSVGGWDPHFAPTATIEPAEVVNLGFVINVIEDPAERLEALKSAFALSFRALSVGVMLSGNHAVGHTAFGDGVLSGRNTFQKYFTQSELKSYLETNLNKEAHLVGPGVAFVFADPETENRFLSRRYRARSVAPRLLAMPRSPKARSEPRVREPRVRASVAKKQPRLSTEAVAMLDVLWRRALDLGRIPDEGDVREIDALRAEFCSYRRAVKALEVNRDMELLDRASKARREDLDLYFAMQHFTRRANRKNPDRALQRDIRYFYGSFSDASAAGMHLLQMAADPEKIFNACVAASEQGLGWLDGQHSLQIQATAVDRLPAILRAYVACGIQLCGAIIDFQIVKIHIASGKLSLMDYVQFDSPVPRLRQRIKLNMRRLDLQVFDYGNIEHPMPPLYQKSRYLVEESETYAEQVAFDEQMQRLGLAESGLGYADLMRALQMRRYEIHGHALRPSTSIPDLDERCGRFLRYRDLIECGETQSRLGIDNKPLRVESYNALYDLAVHVLDPVIDYFGGIRLTYGLCTSELGKHIKRRVAPKLDQHAAAEFNSLGDSICHRGGAACDFLVDDENMQEVADWIIDNTRFDRLYYYGPTRPLHVSYGPEQSSSAFSLHETPSGSLRPSKYPRKCC